VCFHRKKLEESEAQVETLKSSNKDKDIRVKEINGEIASRDELPALRAICHVFNRVFRAISVPF